MNPTIPPNSTKHKTMNVDLHLAVAAQINPKGNDWSMREIGIFCGVSHEAIRSVNNKALKKVRLFLSEQGITDPL